MVVHALVSSDTLSTRSMPILVSHMVSYMDCEVVPCIAYDIASLLAAKQRMDGWWWSDFKATTKNLDLSDFAAQARCADFPVSA